jgi:hypothetical protein
MTAEITRFGKINPEIHDTEKLIWDINLKTNTAISAHSAILALEVFQLKKMKLPRFFWEISVIFGRRYRSFSCIEEINAHKFVSNFKLRLSVKIMNNFAFWFSKFKMWLNLYCWLLKIKIIRQFSGSVRFLNCWFTSKWSWKSLQ